jgi:hypothetical protein
MRSRWQGRKNQFEDEQVTRGNEEWEGTKKYPNI